MQNVLRTKSPFVNIEKHEKMLNINDVLRETRTWSKEVLDLLQNACLDAFDVRRTCPVPIWRRSTDFDVHHMYNSNRKPFESVYGVFRWWPVRGCSLDVW